MRLSRLHTVALIMTVVMGMTSCRDELCYNHFSALSLNMEWEHEWERDYGMSHSQTWDEALHGFGYDELRPGKPEWVNLIRFRADGTRHEDYLEEDEKEMVIDPEEGQSLLLYNGDTEYIVIEDIASLSDAKASPTSRTRNSISYIMEQHPGVGTTNPPDILYATYVDNVPVVSTHEKVMMNVKMQPLVYTYLVRYEFEEGLENVRMARGALGGMAQSVYLRDGHTSDEATIILYDCDLKDYGCEAHVRSFGVPGFPNEYYGRGESDDVDRPYTLNLELLLNNGKTVEFNFDVADQIASQPKGGVIRVNGIRVEIESGGGETSGFFDVDLSDWGNVNVDLPSFDVGL